MDNDARALKEKLARLDQEFPLIPHTNAGRLSSTVRRMKAEKQMDIPIRHRTGFAISVKTGKRANEMSVREWNDFYKDLCDDLKRQYPELYQQIFPTGQN